MCPPVGSLMQRYIQFYHSVIVGGKPTRRLLYCERIIMLATHRRIRLCRALVAGMAVCALCLLVATARLEADTREGPTPGEQAMWSDLVVHATLEKNWRGEFPWNPDGILRVHDVLAGEETRERIPFNFNRRYFNNGKRLIWMLTRDGDGYRLVAPRHPNECVAQLWLLEPWKWIAELRRAAIDDSYRAQMRAEVDTLSVSRRLGVEWPVELLLAYRTPGSAERYTVSLGDADGKLLRIKMHVRYPDTIGVSLDVGRSPAATSTVALVIGSEEERACRDLLRYVTLQHEGWPAPFFTTLTTSAICAEYVAHFFALVDVFKRQEEEREGG